MVWPGGGGMFDSLKQLGTDEVTLYRLAGFTSAGGHTDQHVFNEAETVELVVRPWEDDVPQIVEGGQTGQTPGKKVYADECHELRMNDRIVYGGVAFRLSNLQYDQLNDLERWDARTDQRDLVLKSEIEDEDDISRYGAGGEPDYGGY